MREALVWFLGREDPLEKGIGYPLQSSRIRLQCRRPWFDSWAGKIPCRRDRLPTPVFLGFPGDCGGSSNLSMALSTLLSQGKQSPRPDGAGCSMSLFCFAFFHLKFISPVMLDLHFLNWRIVALWQCVGFCFLTAWIGYEDTHIPSLLRFPPTSHPSPLGHHRAPNWAPCAICQLPTSRLFYTWSCVYVSAALSIHPIISSRLCVHMSALYVCVCLSSLQMGSSLPVFWIPYMHPYLVFLSADLISSSPWVHPRL